MTPAILLLQRLKIPHTVLSYQHDPSAESYGREAAEALDLEPHLVFKTLLASISGGEIESKRGNLIVAILPVDERLNLKSLAKAVGAKKAALADPTLAERSTGYVVGGISPVGQRRPLPTVLHSSAKELELLHVSAGRRGLEMQLAPEDLLRVTNGLFANITE